MSSTTPWMSTIFEYPYLGADNMQEFLWLLILGGFVCFGMAWGIGANDVANTFATSVGARSVTLKQAVILAGIFEFVGALGLGSGVTSTVRKKIVDYDLFVGEEDILFLGMFTSLCSAGLWLFIASVYSYPVSTTHSIIGAIIGFAVAAKGIAAVHWNEVGLIVAVWCVAPFLSAIITMLLFWPIRRFLLRREDSYRMALKTWPLFVFIVAFVMVLFLLLKGMKRLTEDLEFDAEEQTGIAFAVTIGIAVLCAILSYFCCIMPGFVEKYVERAVAKMEDNGNGAATKDGDKTEAAVDDSEVIAIASTTEMMTSTKAPVTPMDVHAPPTPSTSQDSDHEMEQTWTRYQKAHDQFTKGVKVEIHDDMEQLEKDIHDNSEKFDVRTEKSFAWLQVCTASLDSFAHGSNDVANAVAPFAAMYALYTIGETTSKVEVPVWVLLIGAAGIVVGLATYGYNVMKCLGVRMVYVTPTRGYCIELSSALIVIIASYSGFPVSTTHAQVGATVGAGLMEKFRKDSTISWAHVINWKLLAQVFLGWFITLFFTALTSAAIFAVLAYSPYAGEMRCV